MVSRGLLMHRPHRQALALVFLQSNENFATRSSADFPVFVSEIMPVDQRTMELSIFGNSTLTETPQNGVELLVQVVERDRS